MTVEKKAEMDLIQEYDLWEDLYINGGSDPTWPDGVNLNLVRCHIIAGRERLKELKYFPEVYSREVPQEVDKEYMARAEEIREKAQLSLAILMNHEDYQYLLQNSDRIDEKEAKRICLWNVIGYVKNLQEAVRDGKLVEMRRYESPDTYIEALSACREKMARILKDTKSEKEGQMDIFDFL